MTADHTIVFSRVEREFGNYDYYYVAGDMKFCPSIEDLGIGVGSVVDIFLEKAVDNLVKVSLDDRPTVVYRSTTDMILYSPDLWYDTFDALVGMLGQDVFYYRIRQD